MTENVIEFAKRGSPSSDVEPSHGDGDEGGGEAPDTIIEIAISEDGEIALVVHPSVGDAAFELVIKTIRDLRQEMRKAAGDESA